jgi:hypothetical protein
MQQKSRKMFAASPGSNEIGKHFIHLKSNS